MIRKIMAASLFAAAPMAAWPCQIMAPGDAPVTVSGNAMGVVTFRIIQLGAIAEHCNDAIRSSGRRGLEDAACLAFVAGVDRLEDARIEPGACAALQNFMHAARAEEPRTMARFGDGLGDARAQIETAVRFIELFGGRVR